jgi:hypothetical protein
MFEHAHRRFRMKKGLFYLFASLLVLSFSLGTALAGTNVYHVKDQAYPPYIPLNYGNIAVDPFCNTEPCKIFTCFRYDANIHNPAWQYKDDICVSFDATFHETVRIKTNKTGPPDLDWNLVAHGTGYVHPGSVTGGGGDYAATAASIAATNPLRLYYAKRPANTEVLDSGPVQVEEVVQDDGADAVDSLPVAPNPIQLFFNTPVALESLDYVMYHFKIRGNSILFFRFTLRDGNYCYTDLENGGELCVTTW